ncbi:hypothetical protein M0R45_004972 [Rubus argutus]|uniref:BED-type domain-containing protein n=1 Tax=Rubus argutus TaxID=59490 RepID=A0AAW1YLD6_RUBAR
MESNTPLQISGSIPINPMPPIPDELMQPSNTTLGVSPAPEPESEPVVHKKKNNKTSPAWEHYTMMKKEDGVTDRNDKAICNYCRISINCDPKKNGTTALTSHLKSCRKSPLYEVHDKRQRTLAFKEKEDGEAIGSLEDIAAWW